MIVFYGRVIRKLKRKENHILNREQLALKRVHKRITFMVITVTVIFAVTWGAGSAMGVWFVIYLRSNWHLLYRISPLLVAINSSVNCFLYTLFSSQFRKGVKKFIPGLSYELLGRDHKRGKYILCQLNMWKQPFG